MAYGELTERVTEILGRLNAQQNERARLEELEHKMCEISVALAETEGRLVNLKTEVAGELRLSHETLNNLNEKIEHIEHNTSKEESAKRTWRIALVAAIPGVLSIVLRLVEIITGG